VEIIGAETVPPAFTVTTVQIVPAVIDAPPTYAVEVGAATVPANGQWIVPPLTALNDKVWIAVVIVSPAVIADTSKIGITVAAVLAVSVWLPALNFKVPKIAVVPVRVTLPPMTLAVDNVVEPEVTVKPPFSAVKLVGIVNAPAIVERPATATAVAPPESVPAV